MKVLEHESTKLEKIRSNMALYVENIVEREERQRRTYLLSYEALKLRSLKDEEDLLGHFSNLKASFASQTRAM